MFEDRLSGYLREKKIACWEDIGESGIHAYGKSYEGIGNLNLGFSHMSIACIQSQEFD